MITNFHLPKSTLIMLVSAFAGREKILETYETAIREGYRFYSFGDAMLIFKSCIKRNCGVLWAGIKSRPTTPRPHFCRMKDKSVQSR
jgi:hypothetical protein